MKNYGNKPDEIIEGKPLRRAFSGSIVKAIDKDKRQIEFIISTAAVDRMRDIIEVSGWDLKNYKKNPVVLFGHSSHIPPIGKAIKTWKTDTELRSIAEFMPPDISAFAHSIFRMFEEKFLKAVSVGFKPLKYEEIKDENGDWTYGYRFLKQELLEFSAVPIPANPEALVAARSAGIDTLPFKQFAEEMLDNWKVVGKEVTDLYNVDQKGMENIRRRAAGLGATFKVPLDLQDKIRERNLAAIREAKAKKDNQMVLESVTIQGIEFDLPAATDLKDIGTVEIFQNTAPSGTKTYSISKADDKVLMTIELLNDEKSGDFVKAELCDGEDGKQDLIVTLKGENVVVEYDIIGVDVEKGLLVGVKISETREGDEGDDDVEPEDKADDKSADEEEKEEKKSSDEDEDDEDEDEDDEDEDEDEDDKAVEDDDEDEEDDKSADEPVVKTTSDILGAMEVILCEFEKDLDNVTNAKSTVYDKRKKIFLADYFRELADKLDGGKTSEEPKKKVAPKTDEKEEEKGYTPEEATDYIKNFASAIQPHLERMIAEKVNKIRGRLD